MRYYSTQRPVAPGTFPKEAVKEIHNFDQREFCKEIGREAWGYIEYDRKLPPEEAACWELTPAGTLWYPVTVSSRKHGGGLRVLSGQSIRAMDRPEDTADDTRERQFKTRYFDSWEEAQRIMNVLDHLEITTERIRPSAAQGEVKVSINGEYILSFGDKIVLPAGDADPDDHYGNDIGGWRSSEPDSAFVLGLIWHPLDHVYHYSEQICRKLGIRQDEWIG